MANELHLDVLTRGTAAWNQWRKDNPEIRPDLRKATLIERNLSRADLSGADFSLANLSWVALRGANASRANLYGAVLSKADLREANLSRADLKLAQLNEADLSRADLSWTDLSGADLRWAHLSEANLTLANLSRADLSGADLVNASLVDTNLQEATLTNCRVYGISVWNVKLEDAKQLDLIITPHDEPTITVDNLEVAQFIYLLLNNQKIRDVIDTITSKVVLILGRFTPERKAVLDAIRDELRRRNYLPVLFDFEKPASQDITETISTLAHMARFVIADITDPRSIPQELEHFVPLLPSVPVQPLLQASADEYVMFEHFKRFPWVLKIHRYRDLDDLLKSLGEKVIAPAEAKAKELQKR